MGSVAVHHGDPSGHPPLYKVSLGYLCSSPHPVSPPGSNSTPHTPISLFYQGPLTNPFPNALSSIPNTGYFKCDPWTTWEKCGLGTTWEKCGLSDPTSNPLFNKSPGDSNAPRLCNLSLHHLSTGSYGSRAVCYVALCLLGEIISKCWIAPITGDCPDCTLVTDQSDHMVSPVEWQPDRQYYPKDSITPRTQWPLRHHLCGPLFASWRTFRTLQGGS